MLGKLIRIAHENPEIRADLLPIIKEAMEHRSPEALKKYLHEHPKADKSKHTVGKPSPTDKLRNELKKDMGKKKQDVKPSGGEIDTPAAGKTPPVDKTKKPKKEEKKPALKGTPTKLTPDSIKSLDLSSSSGKSTAKSLIKDFAKSQNSDISKAQLDKVVEDMFEDAFGNTKSDGVVKTDMGDMLKNPKKYIKMDKPKAEKKEPAKKDTKSKYNKKVQTVMTKHKLVEDDADEIKAFKKNKPGDKGQTIHPAILMQRFLAKAKPETKERMKGVSPADFMKMLGAIMDEDEGGGGGKQASLREQLSRIASNYPETRKHLIPLLKE